MFKIFKNKKGLTLTELVVVLAVLSVLAAVVMPVQRFTVKRTKEAELKRSLREMRDAIDSFKRMYEDFKSTGQPVPSGLQTVANPDSGYPKTLEELTKVIELPNLPGAGVTGGSTGATAPIGSTPSSGSGGGSQTKKLRFLRKIPVDPMTGNAEWDLRSNADEPDSSIWGGQDVFDVYSQSEGTALDGTKYRDW